MTDKRYKAYYSLIQVCPDYARAEVANVGVVVLCPELKFLGMRTSGDSTRLRAIFPKLDVDDDQLVAVLTSLRFGLERVATREDLDEYIGRLGNLLTMTPTRGMATEDPSSDADAMFVEWVRNDYVPPPAADGGVG